MDLKDSFFQSAYHRLRIGRLRYQRTGYWALQNHSTALVGMGVSADRLTTDGFGDTKPVSKNDTPQGKAENRRVEFVRQ